MLTNRNFELLRELYIIEDGDDAAIGSVFFNVMTKIAEVCKTIEVLIINTTPVSHYIMTNILPLNPNVRELTISDRIRTGPSYELYDVLRQCMQLQRLSIEGPCVRNSSSQLQPIPTLTEVSIDPRGSEVIDEGLFSDAHLCNIAVIAPNLTSMSIDDCHNLTNAGFAYLAMKCPKISRLRLDWMRESPSTTAVLKHFLTESLIDLKILRWNLDMLPELLKRRGQWLQKFELMCRAERDLTPIAEAIIQGCPSLKQFTLFSVNDQGLDFPDYSFATSTTNGLQKLEIRGFISFIQSSNLWRLFPNLFSVDLYFGKDKAVACRNLLNILCALPGLKELVVRDNKGFSKSSAVELAAVADLPLSCCTWRTLTTTSSCFCSINVLASSPSPVSIRRRGNI